MLNIWTYFHPYDYYSSVYYTQKWHYFVVSNKRALPNTSTGMNISFEEKFHPTESYFGLHVYYFEEIFPLAPANLCLKLLVFGIN